MSSVDITLSEKMFDLILDSLEHSITHFEELVQKFPANQIFELKLLKYVLTEKKLRKIYNENFYS